jgi:isoquinoline 1-oxidoreductase subunit beta
VCNIFHAFAIGSFVDELAKAAKADSAQFLLGLLGDPRHVDLGEGVAYPNYDKTLEEYPIDTGRMAGVIKRVRRESDWERRLPARHGLGIAAHRSFHAYVAVVVEAAVDEAGAISVPRVDIAVDLGTVVNPDRVVAQMEGSVIFGLSLALSGEITAKDGRIQQSNFHDYPVQRMHEAPRDIRVHLVSSSELPGGAGEPGVPPIAPALANAVFAATGVRLRDLPLAIG